MTFQSPLGNPLQRAAQTLPFALVAFVLVLGCLQVSTMAQEGERIFELRKYITHEGRLDDLHRRFSEHTNHLFVKHGMQLVAYWTPTEGEEASNTLIYVLSFPSRAARDTAFQAFRDDPAWQAAYKASVENGKIVKNIESTFMKATDYSPIQ